MSAFTGKDLEKIMQAVADTPVYFYATDKNIKVEDIYKVNERSEGLFVRPAFILFHPARMQEVAMGLNGRLVHVMESPLKIGLKPFPVVNIEEEK